MSNGLQTSRTFSLSHVDPRYDNTDGHLDLGLKGYAIPKNCGQYTLKQ